MLEVFFFCDETDLFCPGNGAYAAQWRVVPRHLFLASERSDLQWRGTVHSGQWGGVSRVQSQSQTQHTLLPKRHAVPLWRCQVHPGFVSFPSILPLFPQFCHRQPPRASNWALTKTLSLHLPSLMNCGVLLWHPAFILAVVPLAFVSKPNLSPIW